MGVARKGEEGNNESAREAGPDDVLEYYPPYYSARSPSSFDEIYLGLFYANIQEALNEKVLRHSHCNCIS
jgi:hypothetical protein